jgi:hypothetical protein
MVGKLSTGQSFVELCPVDISHDSLHFLSKSNREQKGLLTSATFQIIFYTFQLICCDQQIIKDHFIIYVLGLGFYVFCD